MEMSKQEKLGGRGFFEGNQRKRKGGSTQSRPNLTNHHYKEPIHPNPSGKTRLWGVYPKFSG